MKQIVLFILFFIFINSQAKDFKFERINSSNGLSQNNVIDVYKDKFGFIWFGTYDGLNRYDGYDFKVYRKTDSENSICSNLIQKIAEDTAGNIWLCSFASGLSVINRNTEVITRLQNTEKEPNLLTSNTASCIFVDSKNRTWYGSQFGLNIITQLDDGNYSVQTIVHDPDNPNSLSHNFIESIFEDSEGRIFLSTRGFLDLIIPDENGLPQNKFYHLGVNTSFSEIGQMVEVQEGYIILHSNGACIVKFNKDNPEATSFIDLEEHSTFSIAKDFEGNLYTSGTEGVYFLKHYPGEEIPYKIEARIGESEDESGLSNQFVRSLLMDDVGILWVGTNGGGVCKYNTQKSRFRHYSKTKEESSLGHKKVWCFYEDDNNNLWIGTEGDGVNLHPATEGKNYDRGYISYPVNPPGQQNFAFDIVDVSTDNTTKLWVGVGYNNKLVELAEQDDGAILATQITPEIANQVMPVHKDEFNNIWLGTYNGGLYKFVPDGMNGKLIRYAIDNSSIKTNIIRNIAEDSKGRLWIGTDKGLMLLTKEQKNSDSLNFTLFVSDKSDSTGINNSYTVPIIETSNNEIWIGTFGGGLNQYHEGTTLTNGTFTNITMEDGLPNNTIKQIVEDDLGNLWVTSNNGLSRIDPTRKKIRNFDINDGLQEMEFVDLSGLKLRDGEILIGGINGFNAFYPEEISEDTIPPIIMLTNLYVGNTLVEVNKKINTHTILNKPLNFTDKIELHYTENTFQIEFSGIHYSVPESNQYKYMLEGLDEDWVQTTSVSRFARYTNIKPGKYQFKVMSSNCYGVWVKEPKVLSITITPPFWQTWWFRILVLLIISGIIIVIYRRRMEKLKREQAELQLRIDESMVEINKSKEEMEKARAEIEEHKEQIRLKDLEESTLRYFNKGLAKFSDIMGKQNNLGELCHAIIMELVSYVDAQIGVFYIITDDDEDAVLKVEGSYGGDSNQYEGLTIMVGEGHVGTCFRNGEVIEITEVSSEYMKISSGLGESTPKYVCFVPLIQNENKSGVIEIASFEKLEDFKVDFIKKLGENITSNIFLMRAMGKNKAIITEIQSQTEEMKAQEEEMRQNIEELMATQEENDRIKQQTEEKINGLNDIIASKEKEIVELKKNIK